MIPHIEVSSSTTQINIMPINLLNNIFFLYITYDSTCSQAVNASSSTANSLKFGNN